MQERPKLIRYTRADVAFMQNLTSRFQENPGESQWTAVKTILKSLRNTKEAEYIAASEAAMEAVWMRKFIDQLGVVPNNKEPMMMLYDNTSAIIIANKLNITK
ncbi:hypothetical protein Tco_1293136, partial [Tanacetum coccineum]